MSHHVQLCTPGAAYIVALDNGRLTYVGGSEGFRSSGVMATLVQSRQDEVEKKEDDKQAPATIDDALVQSETTSTLYLPDLDESVPFSETSSTAAPSEPETKAAEKKSPRKLIEEEKRAVGRIGRDIWKSYFYACGGWIYWTIFVFAVLLAALTPVLENGWLRYAEAGL